MALGQEQGGQGFVVCGREREVKGAHPSISGFFGQKLQLLQHQRASRLIAYDFKLGQPRV